MNGSISNNDEHPARTWTFVAVALMVAVAFSPLIVVDGGNPETGVPPPTRGETAMGHWSKLVGGGWPSNISTADCNVMSRDNGNELVVINRATEGWNSWYEVYSFFVENETWFKWNISGQTPSTSQTGYVAYTSSPDGNVAYYFGGNSQWSGTSDKLNVFFYSNKTWVQYTAPASLGDRYGSGMTYDDATDTVWIFGGRDNDRVRYNDLHTFSLTAGWGNPTPPDPKPTTRDQGLMTCSPDGKFLYIAIGRYSSGGGNNLWCNDLWEYNVTGNTWRAVNNTLGVPTDTSAIFKYRAATGDILLSMGIDGATTLNNTYVINITTGTPAQVNLTGMLSRRAVKGWDLREDGMTVIILGDTSGTEDMWELDIYTYGSLLAPGNPVWAGGSAYTGYDPDDGGKLLALKHMSGSYWQLVYFSLTDEKWHNMFVSGTGTPDYRDGGMAFTYDPVGNDFYLYGGYDSYSVGGGNTHYYFFSEFWKLNVDTGLWTQINDQAMPGNRGNSDMVTDADGRNIYIFGGQVHGGETNTIYKFDIIGNVWSPLSPPVTPSARTSTSLVYYPEKNGFYMFGGYVNSTRMDLNDFWFYHTDTDRWEQMTGASDAPSARRNCGISITIPNDEVLIFGKNIPWGGDGEEAISHIWRPGWLEWKHDQNSVEPQDWNDHGQAYSRDTGKHYIWAGDETEVWEYAPIFRTRTVQAKIFDPTGNETANVFPTTGTYELLIWGITDMAPLDFLGLDVNITTDNDYSRLVWMKAGGQMQFYGNQSWFSYVTAPTLQFLANDRWELRTDLEFEFDMPDGMVVDLVATPITTSAFVEPGGRANLFTTHTRLEVVGYDFSSDLQQNIVDGGWLFGRTDLTVQDIFVSFVGFPAVSPESGSYKITLETSAGGSDEWLYEKGQLGSIEAPIIGDDLDVFRVYLNLTTADGKLLDSKEFSFKIDLDPPTAPENVVVRASSFTDTRIGFDKPGDVFLTWGDVFENGSGLKGIYYSIDHNWYPREENVSHSFVTVSFNQDQEGVHTFYVWAIDNTSRAGPYAEAQVLIDNHAVQFVRYDPDPAVLLNVTYGTFKFEMGIEDPLSGVDLDAIYYRRTKEDNQFSDWNKLEVTAEDIYNVSVSLTLGLLPNKKNLLQFRAIDRAGNGPKDSAVFQVNYLPDLAMPQVDLMTPVVGAELTSSPARLTWSGSYFNPDNLSYVVHLKDPLGGERSVSTSFTQANFALSIPGTYEWYVTVKADGLTAASDLRTFEYEPPFVEVKLPAKVLAVVGAEVAVEIEFKNSLTVTVNASIALENAKGFSAKRGSEQQLGPGETKKDYLILNSSLAETGSYSIRLNITDGYGRFRTYQLPMTVSPAQIDTDDDDEVDGDNNYLLLIIAIVVILIILAIVVFLVLRRRKAEDKEEEKEPEEEPVDLDYDPTGKVAKGGRGVQSYVPLTPGVAGSEDELRKSGSNVVEMTIPSKAPGAKAPEKKAAPKKGPDEVEELEELDELEE